jgi:hypothetical protein
MASTQPRAGSAKRPSRVYREFRHTPAVLVLKLDTDRG